ncbi:hypothetical protein [Thioclava kandeliae]|uniref:Uncharacterized protein n=1 Tax=Thioclava kandeliae TaxID=3070818 RepID=A0ABV1SM14_9RHOB
MTIPFEENANDIANHILHSTRLRPIAERIARIAMREGVPVDVAEKVGALSAKALAPNLFETIIKNSHER